MTEKANERNNPYHWRAVGRSVRGASHEKLNLKNQDSIAWYPDGTGDQPLPLIMAISDGHGGAKYFRSDVGSRLAVTSAIEVLRAFYEENRDVVDPAILKARAEGEMGKRITQMWLGHVGDHVEKNGFIEDEWTRLIREEGESTKALIEGHPTIAYGATLVAVMVTPIYILYLALGDGDILCVGVDGKPYLAIPDNKGEASNETESLINSDAAGRFKFSLGKADMLESPMLILLSTDGYENSYPKDVKDFLNIGPWYHKMIAECGDDWEAVVHDRLEAILAYTSKHGSGDDITLGIIKRAELENVNAIREFKAISRQGGLAVKNGQSGFVPLDGCLAEVEKELEASTGEEGERLAEQQRGLDALDARESAVGKNKDKLNLILLIVQIELITCFLAMTLLARG